MLSSAAPLSDWLAWLETLSPNEIELGLERVSEVLHRLDLDMPAQIILVAGTNGKGSSVAMTDALLRASGLRVGAYTSPHVHRYNERIAVDGRPASDAEIIAAFEQIEAVRNAAELTYFEYGTVAAALVFAAARLDVWILEIGLGGRLDACNAFEPTASLITNIALDHCDWLGHDVESIAAEKAGVMRRDRPVVFGAANVPAAIHEHAERVGARLLLLGRDYSFSTGDGGRWDWSGPSMSLQGLQAPGLLGKFQIGNAAAVLAMLDAAGLMQAIDAERVNAVLPLVAVPGRIERHRIDGRDWVIDVAHNPAAAEALGETLAGLDDSGETLAIVGMLDDKDTAGVVAPLATQVDRWVAMTAESGRAVTANELARRIANLTGAPCLVAGSAAQAIEFARRNTSENDRILVTGSFFCVGPVLDRLTALTAPEP